MTTTHEKPMQDLVPIHDSHLQSTVELYGNRLAAMDGDIGYLKDFYFDDRNWVIRYLIADTGSWLTGRLVLLSPHALGPLEQYERTLRVRLRKMQIENSPSIDSQMPVSRMDEVAYYRYYGWSGYWDGTAMWGDSAFPLASASEVVEEASKKYHHRHEKHLRSTVSVTGHDIQAADGMIGRVTGFLVDDRSWEIREVVAETGHWYAGKEILIPPSAVARISYEESKVFVNLTMADIQRTAENHVAMAGAKPAPAANPPN